MIIILYGLLGVLSIASMFVAKHYAVRNSFWDGGFMEWLACLLVGNMILAAIGAVLLALGMVVNAHPYESIGFGGGAALILTVVFSKPLFVKCKDMLKATPVRQLKSETTIPARRSVYEVIGDNYE